jgi:hypothetical protein
MVRRHLEYEDFFEPRAELNRRVVNLLTSARLFVDQSPQWLAACGHDAAPIKAALGEKHSAKFEFRFMEALRNYVQHSGSAVHNLSFGAKWLPTGSRERQEYSVTPYAQRKYLELDSKFKRSVLTECPDQVDIMHATRVYLESLAAVHELIRKTIDQALKDARTTIESAIARYKRFSKAKSIGLTAFAADESGPKGRVAVFLDWDDVRVKLARRNPTLVNLHRRFVSSCATQAA